MIYRILQMIFIVTLLTGCLANYPSLEGTSDNYKRNRDYTSLEEIYSSFSKGVHNEKVIRLLGEPDYSPIDGQYYYLSDSSEYIEEQGRDAIIGLVVDYRNSNGEITEKIQNYWLGTISE